MKIEDKFRLLLISFLLIIYGILVTQKINLVTADLGRHIKNGELILQGDTLGAQKVLQTNLYSYTYPDYPFLNHHWGSGVIFYLIHRIFGFIGLSVFFTILCLATFLLFFLIAEGNSCTEVATVVSLFVIPVLTSRVEIRPEAFSYFLSGLFFFVLWSVKEKKLSEKFLFALPILMILWVNLHIYFFIGLFLLGVFLFERSVSFFKEKKLLSNLSHLGYLSGILFLATSVSLVNPAGLKGFLYPFKIFGNYGYRLLENQTVWFLDKIIKYPSSLYFKIAFGLLAISWAYVFAFKRRNISFLSFIFSICFSYLGWTAVRNFSLFGFFALPAVAGNFKFKPKAQSEIRFFITSSLAVLIVFGLFILNSTYWVERIKIGVGLKNGVDLAVEFFKKEQVRGPIFNNYDNGGYLVYYLFPKEKVFVDNRPEAYPREFFQDVYIPMQEQEDKWDQMDKKYEFNAIFFYRNDLTPWSQTFLVSRISDPFWAPVYVDDYSIIFTKRNNLNKDLIKKFELPKSLFSVTKG